MFPLISIMYLQGQLLKADASIIKVAICIDVDWNVDHL